MQTSQPITRSRRRTRRTDPSLSHFIDSGADDCATTPKLDMDQTSTTDPSSSKAHPQGPTLRSHILNSPEANFLNDGIHARGVDLVERESEHSTQADDNKSEHPVTNASMLSSMALAGPATVEAKAARRRHKVITYKQRRSLRLHPEEDENKLTLRNRQILRDSNSQTSTPSCSPSPAHLAPNSRKRRRRLPPLKNRLARVARARLTRQRSQEACPQPPVSAPLELLDEGAKDVSPEPEQSTVIQSNVAQRRLAVPKNYTIPDLKDLLNSKSQTPMNILVDRTRMVSERNPLPQFVLPPTNNLHAPRPRLEPKRGRLGQKDMPRLNFVALEAHQEQATMRPCDKRSNQVVEVQRLPLVSQTSPVLMASNHRAFSDSSTVSTARVDSSNAAQMRSPSRVLVKATPEPDEHIIPGYPAIAEGPSFLKASKSSPIRSSNPSKFSNHSHSDPPADTPLLAPMSDLLDDLVKLARSAAQMNNKPVTPNRPTLKRTHQATLTKSGHLSSLVVQNEPPTKTLRFE